MNKSTRPASQVGSGEAIASEPMAGPAPRTKRPKKRRRALSGNGKPTKLTPRQERFVLEYAKDCNATQAAIRAGYAPNVARQVGSRLLTNVDIAGRVNGLAARIAERAEVTAEQVVRRLANIAFSDPRDHMSWGPRGIKLKSSDSLTLAQAAAVSELSETPGRHGVSVRVKFHDKIAALIGLGRHLRIFDGQAGMLSTAEFDGLLAAVMKLLEKHFGPERLDDALIELREITRGRYEQAGVMAIGGPPEEH